MPGKEIQLFFIPYAGGSSASFRKLSGLIDARIETVAVEYPGRGSRTREPLAERFEELMTDVIGYINSRRSRTVPCAVMGYSMGSIIAYEILARDAVLGELKHIFLSAEVSPRERALVLRQMKDPTEEKILERARSLGGLDERMVSDRRFVEIYLKPMISDYRLFFQYRFPKYRHRIRMDATVFYCEKDTAFKDVKAWETLIDGNFDYHEFGEDHFFIHQHYKEMAEIINRNLGKYLDR